MIQIGKNKQGGFTLIELMLVIAIIAIIAAIAIVSFLRSKMAANEVAVIGALRSLVAAQEMFRMADIVDQDDDGASEYGFFQELCGTVVPPKQSAVVKPKFFDPKFGAIIAPIGAANKSGYYFRIYLPGPEPAGPAVGEVCGMNSTTADANEINQRERRWVCYAWPMYYNFTGRRSFVVNQAGTVFTTSASVKTYHRKTTIPAADAAFVVGVQNLSGLLASGVANDGNIWYQVAD